MYGQMREVVAQPEKNLNTDKYLVSGRSVNTDNV